VVPSLRVGLPPGRRAATAGGFIGATPDPVAPPTEPL